MRTLLFFSLLIAGTTFSQSKKDLKAQVVSYQQRLDSMNLTLEKTQRINDSLSSEIQQKENALKNKQATLDKQTRELEILNIQIENLKASDQTGIKLPKLRDDGPFTNGGGNGSGNERASLGNDNHRYLIKKPDFSALSSEESCKIVFRVIVDENGEIIGIPVVIRSSTTTSDEVLIKKASALVKSQAKYNPFKKGAGNTEETILIRINPK